jgi:hypothetical protein
MAATPFNREDIVDIVRAPEEPTPSLDSCEAPTVTPGPWFVRLSNRLQPYVVAPDGTIVVPVSAGLTLANARLIAAAPELFMFVRRCDRLAKQLVEKATG